MSVLPDGHAIGCSAHEPGSVCDLKIVEAINSFHATQLRKTEGENDMDDDGPLSDEYPRFWALLCDKGYCGAKEFCRGVHPTKTPTTGILTHAEVSDNKHVSSDRIMVDVLEGFVDCGT